VLSTRTCTAIRFFSVGSNRTQESERCSYPSNGEVFAVLMDAVSPLIGVVAGIVGVATARSPIFVTNEISNTIAKRL